MHGSESNAHIAMCSTHRDPRQPAVRQAFPGRGKTSSGVGVSGRLRSSPFRMGTGSEPAREVTVKVAAHQETDARYCEARNKVNDQCQVKKRCKIDHFPSPPFSCFVGLTRAALHIPCHGDRIRRASCSNGLKTFDFVA